MRLDPEALAKLLAGRRIASVSGTNGKTTTTHFLNAAVRAWAERPGGAGVDAVVTNADGANLHYGIASALSAAPRAELAILETDERVVPDLVRLGRPEVLVLLNFSRDQLDRNHEIKRLARDWRDALAAAGDDAPLVVANADEPLIVWACRGARRVVWVDTEATWQADAVLCPECGAMLRRTEPDDSPDGEGGDWSCPGCDLAQPSGDWQVRGELIIAPDGTELAAELQVPGRFNIGNAACALAAATAMGVDTATALAGMRTVTSPAGRFATTTIAGSTVRLLLAKNPAGWAESLPLAQTPTVVLAINAAAADGRDLSWLWDVEYEQLQGRTVIATGPRAHDLAVRLLYAGVEHRCVPDLAEALTGHPEPVDVISTYTPFQRLRKMGGL
ncbi:MurT ligase domain-containing protein [Microlunatus sp. Y2014]|uniref:MurT ligase domain-containing protein n=1 Tax=Microlunatus sp. Y2014 TaxID=3418488 RepID=UPI003DA6F9EB